MANIIKISKHSTKFANYGKQVNLSAFLTDYNDAKWWFVDYLWKTPVYWGDNKILDIKNNQFDVPSFISTVDIDFTTDLSARAIKRASSEALDIVKSQTQKRKQQLYILNKLTSQGKTNDVIKLQLKIDSKPLTKPTKTSFDEFAKLDSNCCEFIPYKTNEFDGFLKLHGIGKKYGHIYVPIKYTKHSNNLMKKGYEMMTTWQISDKLVASTWQLESQPSTGTKIIGADQGLKTCLSLSDRQTTTSCPHGHDLDSITTKLSRKKRGSKAFARAAAHRTNYANWSINQLNLHDVKEIRLEKLFQMRTGQNVGNKLSHWTYTQINTQIKSRCDELGVLVKEQSPVYRSQRCSDCGWVQKTNRIKKDFICKHCGATHDADINGALNHVVDLFPLPYRFFQMNLNKTGFFWKENGLFYSSGQEITVPVVN
jgi:transposase